MFSLFLIYKSLTACDLSDPGLRALLPKTKGIPRVFLHLILRANTYNLHLHLLESRPVMSLDLVVWASLVAQRLKRLPPMRETQVRSLGWEDPLEKEMAIHSSILAWGIPWTEKPSRLQSTGSQRGGHD